MKNTSRKIGILSDTHNLLRPEVMELLKDCDGIIHGGDISSPKILEELQALDCPLYVVRGNNDKDWAGELPQELYFSLYGLEFYMVHNKKHVPREIKGVDVILYGHSHKYQEETRDGVLYLNPGSCGPRRFHQPITMALLHIQEESRQFRVEKIDILLEIKADKYPKIQEKDMEKLVRGIEKEQKKGTTIAAMAKKFQMSRDFIEQVCRIFVTHPGVTARGVMDKMEVNKVVTKAGKE